MDDDRLALTRAGRAERGPRTATLLARQTKGSLLWWETRRDESQLLHDILDLENSPQSVHKCFG